MSRQWASRYRVVPASRWRWSIQTGDGTRKFGTFYRKRTAQLVAQELLTAFMDGQFVAELRNANEAMQ